MIKAKKNLVINPKLGEIPKKRIIVTKVDMNYAHAKLYHDRAIFVVLITLHSENV